MHSLTRRQSKRFVALLLAVISVFSLFPGTGAMAAQPSGYRDPAEHWQSSGGRTNELDANAVVTHETFYCCVCEKFSGFTIWRTPEYTRDGVTALSRNIVFSDGTTIDGGTGVILDGTPGVDAYYTGYHWTKDMCENCGTLNANGGTEDYSFGKNLYNLFDCADKFMDDLPETVSYEYVDESSHLKTTKGGEYCCFCYGTRKTENSVLERHTIEEEILPQPAHGRFAAVDHCTLCDYSSYEYTGAKAVVADYYGVADGQPHTITVSDLSESGVTTQIRYGNSAESCNMTTAPNYTEEGQYAVYYEITYTYRGKTMTENGVANVWLRDDTPVEGCACGCGDPDCGCQDNSCGGGCCGDKNCNNGKHNFTLLESTPASCLTLGYDRYLCSDCGRIEKRDYTAALGHNWQGILIREANCETDGKLMEICSRCGQVKVTATPKGEHQYTTYPVAATCTNPGYTVNECSVCGDRHITDITSALPHSYEANVIPASCEAGGRTVHLCGGCGSSFVTDYTEPLGHSWDKGTLITDATCTGEGMTEYRCVRCGFHRLEGDAANGHVPGNPATCTTPQLCKKCGAVIENALGHAYTTEVTDPTCTEMGYTILTCDRCGNSVKGDYIEATGHKPTDWIVDREPTTEAEGSRHKECGVCSKTLETEAIKKLYLTATTDTHGEAVVGGYLVIVTDTNTKNPVSNAAVALNKDNTISIRLPDGRLLDYDEQTTVTVLLTKDKSAVPDLFISVTDKNGNYSADTTNKMGEITVPRTKGQTGRDGKTTVGYEDEDGDRHTLTIKVEDHETGRPIEGADVSIGKTGNVTVILPDGVDMDEDNRITITVTDNENKPIEDINVTVKDDLGQKETGKTGEDGKLTVPEVKVLEHHGAYVIGRDTGDFSPDHSITRAEAATIFARLLAEKKGDFITTAAVTKFTDIPSSVWYSGYVKYLSNFGVIYGRGDDQFAPDEAITRAEFTAMAVRFFDAYGGGNDEIKVQYAGFTDVSEGYWAAEYIRDAAVHGWIYGYGDGTFRADYPITRAETVTLVNRLLGREADKEYISANLSRLNTFPDVDAEHWAYYDILEAANTHNAAVDGAEIWSK